VPRSMRSENYWNGVPAMILSNLWGLFTYTKSTYSLNTSVLRQEELRGGVGRQKYSPCCRSENGLANRRHFNRRNCNHGSTLLFFKNRSVELGDGAYRGSETIANQIQRGGKSYCWLCVKTDIDGAYAPTQESCQERENCTHLCAENSPRYVQGCTRGSMTTSTKRDRIQGRTVEDLSRRVDRSDPPG